MILITIQIATAENPWAGPEYLSYSSLYEKTTITQTNGSQRKNTLYSYGTVSSDGSTYRLTRYNRNGIVTTLNNFWLQTRDNYHATPNFQTLRPDGSRYTFYTRKSAVFSCNYFVPAEFPGVIKAILDADLTRIDNLGNRGRGTRASKEKDQIPPGSSGRISLRPPSGTITDQIDGWGVYYLNN